MSEWFTCYQCNQNCQKSIEDIIEMDLDPESDNNYDRMIFCPYWGENAIFEKDN